ncbi:YybH family protein [Persicitalea jodogahamensis]|nr:hypothetical protein [Persicitalea jodogahamensis]
MVLLVALAVGCQTKEQPKEIAKSSSTDLKAEIRAQVDSLYEVYEKFGYEWIDFYDDEYTAIYPNSPIKLMNKDSLRAQWKGIYQKYHVKLIERGEPTIIESEDMAISYNSFNEIFVNKVTNDTTKNVGTYIIAWKRQPDDSWKIVFETLHNN